MRVLLGGTIGFGVGLGLIIVAGAWFGAFGSVRDRSLRRSVQADRLLLRSVLGVAAAGLAGWWTGWVAAAVAAGVGAAAAPSLIGVSASRRRQIARSEAVAVWAEMLRDLLVTNAGLREAIAKSARLVPDAIATEVKALEVRAQRGALGPALRRFADDLNDPIGDTVVVALLLAEQRAVSDLGEMLAATATSAREAVAMQLRVNAARARVFHNAQIIAAIIGLFIVAIVALNRDYLEPFGSVVGQIALTFIFGLFGGAVWVMVALSKPAQAPRLLRFDGTRA